MTAHARCGATVSDTAPWLPYFIIRYKSSVLNLQKKNSKSLEEKEIKLDKLALFEEEESILNSNILFNDHQK